MMPSTITFLLAAAAALHLLPGSDASVEATCNTIASNDPNIRIAFCVQSLSRVPGSASADTRSLALIAVDLSSKKADGIASTVEKLLATAKGKEKESLSTCSDVYEVSRSRLADSGKAVEQNRLADARTYLSASVDAPGDCERAFEEVGVASPLKEENADEEQLCIIALAITNLLK